MVTPYIPIPVRYPHPHLIRSYGFLEIVSVSSMAEQSKPVKLAVNDAWPGRHRHPKFWVRKMWGKTTENRWLSKKTWHVYTRGIMAQIVGMSAEKNNKKQTYFGMVQNDWTVMISFVSPYPTSRAIPNWNMYWNTWLSNKRSRKQTSQQRSGIYRDSRFSCPDAATFYGHKNQQTMRPKICPLVM